ncbi:SRPBCC family protein [Roseivirga echinicomitans]|uniref:START domain-containing protein n=1 Tax=Roseivirga echinicomitans TaxID=296218 RepID=A0A150X371_9BACT|nr:hypothetical protein [Roseivirga echinicomitans]KYG73168.1 hypothetical protein AWN68_10810 [Roseivirga echinicomitans]
MQRLLAVYFFIFIPSAYVFSQKTWVDKGISITQLDTLGDGYESLRGSFMIENSSIYEVMNLILDVDGYDWVEGESRSEMLLIDHQDSTFTFDFFVNIPWLFVKRTGRIKVDVHYKDETFHTGSTQLRNYNRNEDYDLVDFYSAEWKVQKHGENNVKVSYLGVYQDQKMVINLNSMVINKIRKRLNSTLYNLKVRASEKVNPVQSLVWPMEKTNTKFKSEGNR